MQRDAKVWFVSLALTLFGCAKEAIDDAERTPSARPSASSDISPYGVAPYNPSRAGSGGQASKGGASSGIGGTAGHADSGGTTSGASGVTGLAGAAAGGTGGASAGGASTGGASMGSGGTGAASTGSSASGGGAGSAASAAASSNSGATAACPSLTLARLPSGACVDRIVEFSVAAHPTSIVTGSDGRVWVDDDSGNRIVRLESDGRVLDHVECAANSAPRALLAGSGQTLIWYTDAHEKTLVGVDQNLQSFAFSLNFVAMGLTHGQADELWLSEYGQAVYRLSPSKSTITKFPAAPSSTLVFGPDNNLWFQENALIARLIPDVEKTSFPTGDGFATDLSAGPDAALWFTDDTQQRIGRLQLDGTVSTLYELPRGTQPFRIINGPDGALWFTERGTDKIGRISLDGVITHYPVPTSGGLPYALTFGADHNLWFTENRSGKVGRLIPDRQ